MALPMPVPTVPPLPLPSYKLLSFDVYGTLIEYKAHILAAFTPLLSRLPPSSPYLDPTPLSPTTNPTTKTTKGQILFLQLFQSTEDTLKLSPPPLPRFDALLSEIWTRVAAALSVPTTPEETAAFGSRETIASWPPFPGTPDALRALAARYRLVALSNIDRYAWGVTAAAAGGGGGEGGEGGGSLGGVAWTHVFTAEDYPGDDPRAADDAKFAALLEFAESQGVAKEEVLHVAQSLGHDHAPAKRAGVASVFLVGDGGVWGKEVESRRVVQEGTVGYAWRCRDLRGFAGVVDEAWRGLVPVVCDLANSITG